MKKFFTLITAVLFAGGMMAEGLLFEQTYPGTPSSKTNAYDASFTLATDGYTLTYANVNNGSKNDSWDVVRAGRKSAASVATVTSEAIAAKVSKVVIDFTQVDVSKTNELCLLVANNAAFTNATKVNATIAIGAVTFTVAEPAENMYYQISMDMVAHGSSNGFNRWSKIQFITPEGGTPIVAPTYDTLTVAQAKEIAQALADKATSKEKYYVEGYAVNVAAYSTQYGNQIFFMVDDVNAPDSLFEAYAAYPAKDGKAYPVLAGDKVRAFGALKKYGTQLEIDHPAVEFISEVEGDRTIQQPITPDPVVTPELPEGVLNCAGVKTLAATASDPTAENKTVEVADVKVRGYVISVYAAKNGTQSAWIADDKNATAGEVQGYNLTITEEVAKGDYVHMEGKLAKFFKAADNIILEVVNGTMAKVAADGTVTPVDPTPVQLDTITVAKALEIGRALDSAAVTPNQYVIKGYVSNIETPYDPSYKNETFWMTDEKGSRAASNAAGAFEVYRGKPDTEKEIGLDAYVFVTAKIQKFKGTTIETSGNVTVQVVEQGVAEVIDTITVAQALEIGKELTESNKDNSYPSEKRYAIKGYVSSIVERYSSYGNETFWITDTKGSRTNDKEVAFEVYRGKPNTGAEVGLDAYVMIVCKIKNYQGTIENDGTNVPVEVLEQGELKIDTITVAQAIEKTQALAAGAVSEEYYAVKAYIAGVQTAYSAEFGNISLFLSDDPTATQSDFSCYRAKIDAADVEKAVHGAYVIVTGHLDNNSHGLQMAQGASIEFAEAPKVQRITVAQALELGNALAVGTKTAELYEVVGYVASILEAYEEGVQSFIMTEDATATTGSFYIGNASIAAPGAAVHDYVGVVGFIENDGQYIQIYNGQATINPAGEGIELINVATPKAQKVLMDGVIYIVRDGKIFNLQGAQVR